MTISGLLTQAQAALQGEPLRFITYGAAIVVWLVVLGAHALGLTTFGPTLSLTDALIDSTVAAAVLAELVRRYVSPAA